MSKKEVTTEEREFIDKHLLNTQYLTECKQLPLDILEDDEIVVVEKCLNQEDLTDDELAYLKEVLYKYREAMKKLDVANTEESVEKVRKHIKSEKELLALIDELEENYTLKMIYRLKNGEEVILDLVVKPLTDSQAISEMQAHADLFKELNTNERVVWGKVMQGQTIYTEEEKKLANHIAEKYEEQEYDMETKIAGMREFLARQVEFENASFKTYNKKLKFWNRIEVATVVDLYNKVRTMLHIDEEKVEDLFLNE
ncbi:MAG: hypothetical protein IJF83_05925 [Methanobrevibacter sp.]|nr:hypothetical protein [Methanobrevibacter sp.]MBQ2653075.1 hypothetical protein [Methanobrevibacter sp.]